MKRDDGKRIRGKKPEAERAGREHGKPSEAREPGPRFERGEGLDEDLSILKERAEKASEYYESLLRLKAEFDNFKKRTRKEMAEAHERANEELMLELLPVIDSLELGLKSAKETRNFDKLVDGIELSHNKLLQILGKFGLNRVDAAGRKFDPNYHEAVTLIESDTHHDDAVVDEIRKGYLLYNKLLRPAMVTVAQSRGRPSPEEKRGEGRASGKKGEKEQE